MFFSEIIYGVNFGRGSVDKVYERLGMLCPLVTAAKWTLETIRGNSEQTESPVKIACVE